MERSDIQKRLMDYIEDNGWMIFLIGAPALGGVLAHFANWSPAQLVAVIAALLAAGILITGLMFWRSVRLAQADATLKQAMLERGLSVDEMERLLRPTPAPELPLSDEEVAEKLAHQLGLDNASEETIKLVMGAFNASDSPTKRLLYRAIFGLSESQTAKLSSEQILAIVRGLSRPDGKQDGPVQNAGPKPALEAASPAGKGNLQIMRAEQLAALDRPHG